MAALVLTRGGILQAADESTCIITVSEGSSIQSAIDAAPSGALVCIGEGTWSENVIIRKSVSLRGAGVDRSRIVALDEASPVIDIRYDQPSSESASLDVRIASLSIMGGTTGIQIMGSVEASLVHLRVQGSRAFGVYASDGKVIIENSTVQNNEYSGILVDSAQATIKECHVLSNSENGVYLLGHWASSTTVHAEPPSIQM
jgi:nitrous oxidase accessory protein NosD